MFFKKLLLIFPVIFILGCDGNSNTNILDRDVSLISLITSPGEYDGGTIRLIGYANIEPESTVIYLSEDDAKFGNWANAFWLELDENVESELLGVHGWVLVEGIFSIKNKGHLGLFDGAVVEISRMDVLEHPEGAE